MKNFYNINNIYVIKVFFQWVQNRINDEIKWLKYKLINFLIFLLKLKIFNKKIVFNFTKNPLTSITNIPNLNIYFYL